MQIQERRRAVLTPRNRLVETVLAGRDFDEATVNQATIWGNALLRARDLWAAAYRQGRCYSDRELGRERNSLAAHRKGEHHG